MQAVLVIIVILIVMFIWLTYSFINEVWFYVGSYIHMYKYIIIAFPFMTAGVLYIIYLRPHELEKYFDKYRKGKISKNNLIEMVEKTIYKNDSNSVPPIHKSRLLEKRTRALAKRVQSEKELIEEICEFIKAKNKIDRI